MFTDLRTVVNCFGTPAAEFMVIGQPASKANSRKMVTNRKTGKPMFIKSDAALGYERDFTLQCPKLPALLEGDLWVWIDVWYRDRRSDVDVSIMLDCMQDRIYKNDRAVRLMLLNGTNLDKKSPRAFIRVGELPDGRERTSEAGNQTGNAGLR